MLKHLAILAMLLGFLGGAWPQVPRNGSSQHNNAQEKQKPADSSKPVVVVESQHGANNQEQASEKPPDYQWHELFAPANIPNWFLVVVGGITGWFVYKTLKAIKKQADIMEAQARDARESGAEASRIALATAKAAQKSADAALKTVQVMVDSERPWLVAHFKGENESCLLENGNMRLRWEVRNVGKSPARLIEAGARLILDTMEPGWTNPSDFGHIDSLDGRILVPGDCIFFHVFWSKTDNGVVRTAIGKRCEDFNDLVVGYGFVKYRSVVGEGEDLITRFCECASIDGGIISEPFTLWEFAGEEYLRCT